MKAAAAVIVVAAVLCCCCCRATEDEAYKQQRDAELATQIGGFRQGNYTSLALFFSVGASSNETAAAALAALGFPNATSLADPFRAVFFPRVDQFSLLRLAATRNLAGLGGNVTVRAWAELGGARSDAKLMLAESRIVGARSLVVALENGNVTALAWDDDCESCVSTDCLDGACSTDTATLTPPCDDAEALAKDAFRCGVKVYVAWTGTDVRGKDMTSIAKLPSRFTKYSLVSSIYEAAAGFWEDFNNAWITPQD